MNLTFCYSFLQDKCKKKDKIVMNLTFCYSLFQDKWLNKDEIANNESDFLL